MSWLTGTVDKVAGIIEKAVPNKDEANALKAQISSEILAAGSAAVMAEASGNWLQRSWRPITALVFVVIILFNYMFVPLINMNLEPGEALRIVPAEIPEKMWSLLQIMIGGFVLSRGGEKITKMWKGGK